MSVCQALVLVFILLTGSGTGSSPRPERCFTRKPGEDFSLPVELPSTIDAVWIRKDGFGNESCSERDGHKMVPPDVEPAYLTQVMEVDNKFTLKNVSSSDNGTYTLFNKEGEQLAIVYLHVSSEEQHCFPAKPGENVSLQLEELPSTIDAVWIRKDGLEKDIYCERDGHRVGPPDVEPGYYHRVERVGNNFTLKNVSSSDNGTYTLFYKDEEGEHLVIVYLHVSSEEQHCITAKPGENVSLPYQLPSNTTFDRVWMKKDGLDNESCCEQDRHKMVPPVEKTAYWIRVKRVDNKFTLKNVSSSDSGKYSLFNKGEQLVIFYLHVSSEVDWWKVVVVVAVAVIVLLLILAVAAVVKCVKCMNCESGRDEAAEEETQMTGGAADSFPCQQRLKKMKMKFCNEEEETVF